MENFNICDIYNAFEREFLATSDNVRCVSNMRIVDGKACFTINNAYDLYVWFNENHELQVESEYGDAITEIIEGDDESNFLYDKHVENRFSAEDVSVEDREELTLSVPLDRFTIETQDNLKSLIVCKSELIMKSLKTKHLSLNMTREKLLFPWFENVDAEHIETYKRFVAAICDMAVNQKKITAVPRAGENERYAFRCFLLRLGFIGDEYKKDREILLKNLDPNSVITYKDYFLQ